MSCDVAAAAFLMFAAASGPAPGLQTATAAPAPVASEPLFRDIVARAGRLKAEIEQDRAGLANGKAGPPPGAEALAAEIGQLAVLDQQGSDWLKQRGSDGDLKCILHGIAQDLPLKLAAMRAAASAHDEDLALRDMAYLLRDNVEVITAPPIPAA